MLASALRLLIAFEIVVYAIFAVRFFDLSPACAALAVLAGMLAVRAVIIAITYVYAWTYHSPASHLSALQALRMVLAEYAAFLASFVLILPFEACWMGADRLRPASDRPPLLLIHGYGCSRGAWWWLRRRLEAAGWTVATISLEPVYTGIDNYVEPLARRIDAVLAETGAAQLILVGHSMGGLVARAYFRRFGIQRVAKLVTLGTPHSGSRLARLGMGENGRQMVPGSEWLQGLARATGMPETIVIYSAHDNYVMPQSNLQLPGATNRALDGIGHLAMLYSPRVADALLAALAQQRTASAGWQLRRG
jgi:triacylglycerol lipase